MARCKQLQDDTTIILSLEAAAKFCSPKQLIPKITHFHEADRPTETDKPQAKRFEVAAAGLVACLIADFLPDLVADNASPRPEQNSSAQNRTKFRERAPVSVCT